MNRIALALGLLLTSMLSHGENDIWNSLFRDKLNEANSGNSEAQYDVGTMYQNGRGVQADRNKALEWYRKAAAQNHPRAVSRLNLMEENATRFDRTFSQAEKGDRESLYDLGNMYMMGVGADIDYISAIKAFEQSANQGYDKAAYKLGLIYYEGTGVRSNPTEAFKWFGIAAEDDFPAAQYYLGRMYGEGKGTRRNNTLALQWLGKAVDGGFDQARVEIINVTENLNMEKAAARTRAAPKPEVGAAADVMEVPKVVVEVTNSKQSASTAPAKNTVKQQKKPRATSRQYQIEDLMLGAWSRDSSPVPYLPSAINNCRTEDNRIVCYSEDQTSKSGNNVVRFKTKAIIENFSNDGSFSVTYRNLVIEANPATGTDVAATDGNSAQAPQVKTGWGSPHTLECSFKNGETLSCLKNNTHAFLLTSPRTLAVGK